MQLANMTRLHTESANVLLHVELAESGRMWRSGGCGEEEVLHSDNMLICSTNSHDYDLDNLYYTIDIIDIRI